MDSETLRALVAVNQRFYRTRAEEFARHRASFWPGFDRLWEALPAPPRSVLDLGCGHGRFAAFLAARSPAPVRYLGIDFSAELLALARRREDLPRDARFVQLDLCAAPGALPRGRFDLVVAIGLLHHVPGAALRRAVLESAAGRLAPGGSLAVTRWRFLYRDTGDPARIEPAQAGIDAAQLEPGDALLPFAGDASVPRFCHLIAPEEFAGLPGALGLEAVARFVADGRAGDQNEYLVLGRAA